MQKKSKKNAKSFKIFIQMVRFGDISDVCKRILEECGVSKTTMSKWTRGLVTPSKTHQNKLNQIAQDYQLPKLYDYGQ